ncbi:MAG: signal peptide peptidase SppA [Alphaproteobacteria bacterium]|nr:MAG: signal peptide peptidase SppA [Alphaproteobacteria bacterium]
MLGRIGRILGRFLAVIGGGVVLVSVLGWIVLLNKKPVPVMPLPERMVLTLDLAEPLVEDAPDSPLVNLVRDMAISPPSRLRDVVRTLDAARKDERVRGLVVTFGDHQLGLAQAQEIATALERFRASGKFALAYAPSFGEASPGDRNLFLATQASRVYVQPVGSVGLAGLLIEIPYFRAVLDRFGVEPQIDKREAYKSAMNSVTDRAMGQAEGEMMTALARDVGRQIVTGISLGRCLPLSAVIAARDSGPLLAQEAQRAGLIDGQLYADQVLEQALDLADGEMPPWQMAGPRPPAPYTITPWQRTGPLSLDMMLGTTPQAPRSLIEQEEDEAERAAADADEDHAQSIDWSRYLAHVQSKKPKSPGPARVALIYGTGMITAESSHGGFDPTGSNDGIAARDMVETLRMAEEDDDLRVVILRLDTPGGSATASETIRRGVDRLRAAGKTVIVSMGATAASGGYWIASAADVIIAQPGTLTGSIGVLTGKMALEGLWKKLDVTWGRIQDGRNVGMWSNNTPYTPSEHERVNAALDDIYQGFLDRVAQGRHLDRDAVRRLAGGRVWTGAQAKELGLVDHLGGLDTAMVEARRRLGMPKDAPLAVRLLPPEPNLREAIMGLLHAFFADIGAAGRVSQSLAPMVKTWGPWLRAPSPHEARLPVPAEILAR